MINPLKQRLIQGLADIPEEWSLTPVSKKKNPYRKDWQTEDYPRKNLVQEILNSYPYGYGVRTGAPSGGLLAVDQDGFSAGVELDRLSGGEIPHTVGWTSGTPGKRQFLVQLSESLQERLAAASFKRHVIKCEENEQLEFRYTGHQSVLPPSYHPKTGQYQWINSPVDTPVAPAPQWLEDFLFAHCDRIEAEKAENERKCIEAERERELRRASGIVEIQESAEEWLFRIDPNPLSWDEYMAVLLAAHEEGIPEFTVMQWSQGSVKHDDRGFYTIWRYVKGSSDGYKIGTLRHYAYETGYKKPKRVYIPQGPDPVEYAAFIARQEEQEQNEEAQRRQEALDHLERCFKRSIRKYSPADNKGFNDSARQVQATVDPAAGAIVLYDRRNDGRLEMHVTPATVPPHEEWIDRGRPTLIVQPDDRLFVCLELIKKGYSYVLIRDVVGNGKTRTAGEFLENWEMVKSLLAESLSADEVTLLKAVYLSKDYRRPTHEWLEAIPEAVSGAAEMMDTTKTTPLGNPHRRRARRGETPDIPALCSQEPAYQELNAQGFPMGRGRETDFCKGCPMLKAGCGYLDAVEAQQSEEVLRSHVSKFSPQDGEQVIAFVDEAGQEIAGDVTREAWISAIDREMGELLRSDPGFYGKVAPVLKVIKQGVEYAVEEQGQYGMAHEELMKYLPDRETLQEMIHTQYEGEDETCNVWDTQTISQIAGRLQTGIRKKLEEQLQATPDPKDRLNLVEQNLTIGVLPRLMKAIEGRTRVDVSISGKKITFRYGDRRHGRALAKAKTVFLMDATPDRRELARNLGIDEHDIISISSPKPSFNNLTFKVVKGFGRAGQNREYSIEVDNERKTVESPHCLMQRILALVEKVSQDAIAHNPDIQIGVLDLMKFIDRHKNLPVAQMARAFLTGYHFNDGRNTNRFKECSLLFSIGTPAKNLGALLSQWHLKTGKSHTVETAPPAFWAWVNRMVTTELLQEGGRSRAQHRPNEPITHYILSDLSQGQIQAIQEYFTGCTVEVVDAYDVCPESAPKGEQTRRGVYEAIASAIKAGDRLNINIVAAQVGVTKSRISQILEPEGGFRGIKKSLVSLFNALNKGTKLFELTDNQRIMAQEAFPDLVKELEAEADPAEAIEEFIKTAEILGYSSFEAVFRDEKMLAAVPVPVATKLIGFFSRYLPRPFLEVLEEQTRELVEVAA